MEYQPTRVQQMGGICHLEKILEKQMPFYATTKIVKRLEQTTLSKRELSFITSNVMLVF